MEGVKLLIVIEELGDITTSGAIVNYNISTILSKEFSDVDMVTLDSISERIKKDWQKKGRLFLHKKNNLTSLQKWVKRIPKLMAMVQIVRGNDFEHHNRISQLKEFFRNNDKDYSHILFLSAGLGFTPHQAIKKKWFPKAKLIGVYHDPYPLSSYPEPYNKSGNWRYDYFKRRNLQKSFSKLDFIVFPSLRLYEWYQRDYKIEDKRVSIIPHAIDFTKKEMAHSKNERLIMTHAGTLLKPRNPGTFLKIVSEYSDTIETNFYGTINKEVFESIKAFNTDKNINLVNERIPYEKALEALRNSDFLILIESDGKHNPFLPTKFVDYVNIGRPIIALTAKNSEVSRLLGDTYPFSATLNDETGIRRILSGIRNTEKVLMANKKIEELQQYFSKENILTSYKAILK